MTSAPGGEVRVKTANRSDAIADELRTSEIRYRRLFEAAQDGVLLVDPTTRKITDANPFMTKLLEYRRDQLVGKELFEIGLLADETASQFMFQKLKRKGQIRYENLPLESRRGRQKEVEVVANLYQENGHTVIQCNIRDITVRKAAADLLRRNEALFSTLVEQAPVGILVMDARFALIQVNPVALLDFERVGRLIGENFFKIMRIFWPKRVADQIAVRFRSTLKTGRPYHLPEFTERRRDLRVTEVYDWQIQRVTLPTGEVGVVCFFNNITARKRAESAELRLEVVAASNRKLKVEITRRRSVESALKQSEARARESLKEIQQWQGVFRRVSHQMLMAEENQRKKISRELHDDLSQVLIGINVHLAAFVKQVTSDPKGSPAAIAPFRRLVEKSLRIVHRFARELRPASLDDLGLIAALQAYIHELPRRDGRRIVFSADPAVENLDDDKRTVLYRVAQEALTNVARHARAKLVKVVLRMDRGCVRLEVADDGKAFNAGAAASGKRRNRLGLIGMRERVEMVGGEFSVVSTSGKGTTVRAVVPFRKARQRL